MREITHSRSIHEKTAKRTWEGIQLVIDTGEGENSMIKFFRDKKGYKKFADSGKSVHRHVAERKLGRKLRKGEVVHHQNRNKSDNR